MDAAAFDQTPQSARSGRSDPREEGPPDRSGRLSAIPHDGGPSAEIKNSRFSDKLTDTREATSDRQTVDDDKRRALIMLEEMEQPGIRNTDLVNDRLDQRFQTNSANGPMNEQLNPHQGSDFDDFLKSEGIYEEVMASPRVKKAFKDLSDSIEAGQHEAFAAGWNAFLATHSVLLIAHGIKDFRVGFERAWTKYWEKRKESNPALATDRTAKKLSTLPQNRRLRMGRRFDTRQNR